MTISITPLMHNTIASSIYSNILSKSSKYYYFLGKTVPYTVVNGIEQIETPLPTYNYELSTRKDIISFKEITENDISFVIPRINWETGTIYDHYDDSYVAYNSQNVLESTAYSGATSINEALFYVLTDEYNLYICLDNNNNSASTVKPIGYDTLPFTSLDGYKWKFVMNITSALRVKFLTSFYIPITTAVNNIFYNNGAIDKITIDNSGSGYPSNTTATITVTSGVAPVSSLVIGRTYAIASLGTTTNAQWNTIAGTLNQIYLVGNTITSTVTSGTGTGTIKGTGAVVKPRVSTVDGHIERIDIISGGSGYPSGTTLSVIGVGTGKAGVAGTTALLTPTIVGGVIDFVSIDDPGVDYNQNNTTLTIQSDSGVDAHLSAIVENGQIIDVIIDEPGNSYKSANVTAFGSGGSDAKFTVSTSGGQLNTIQANVELLTIDGSIDYIRVVNQGAGYDGISIVIDGDGTGATAEAILVNRKLVKINITNRGEKYTCATINIIALGSSPTEVAIARAIISPKYGHGKNAIKQLCSSTLMFYNTISNTNSSGFTFNNDYRQFGIIKNPTKFESLLLYNNLLGTACYVIEGSISNGPVVEDMVLTNSSGKKFVVISVDVISTTKVKILLQPIDNAEPVVGLNLTNNLLTVNINSVINPSVDKYSGDMLYIDNRAAFFQTEDQTVTLQTLLKF